MASKKKAVLRKHLLVDEFPVLVDFWLGQSVINLEDERRWKSLCKMLLAEQKVDLEWTKARKIWIKKVDPKLHELTGVKVKSRSKLGWNDNHEDISTANLNVLSKRLEYAKERRQGAGLKSCVAMYRKQQRKNREAAEAKEWERHNADAMLTQSIFGNRRRKQKQMNLNSFVMRTEEVTTYTVSDEEEETGTNAEVDANEKTKMVPIASTSRNLSSCSQDKNDVQKNEDLADRIKQGCEENREHRVKYKICVPTKFESDAIGSQSCGKINGFAVPDQIFSNQSFFLSRDEKNVFDCGVAGLNSYFIRLQGGHVVESIDDITETTIVVQSLSKYEGSCTLAKFAKRMVRNNYVQECCLAKKFLNMESFLAFATTGWIEPTIDDVKENEHQELAYCTSVGVNYAPALIHDTSDTKIPVYDMNTEPTGHEDADESFESSVDLNQSTATEIIETNERDFVSQNVINSRSILVNSDQEDGKPLVKSPKTDYKGQPSGTVLFDQANAQDSEAIESLQWSCTDASFQAPLLSLSRSAFGNALKEENIQMLHKRIQGIKEKYEERLRDSYLSGSADDRRQDLLLKKATEEENDLKLKCIRYLIFVENYKRGEHFTKDGTPASKYNQSQLAKDVLQEFTCIMPESHKPRINYQGAINQIRFMIESSSTKLQERINEVNDLEIFEKLGQQHLDLFLAFAERQRKKKLSAHREDK